MKKNILAMIGCAVLLPALAQADEGNRMARVRLIDVQPHASSSSLPGVDVGKDTQPELDLSYFFTRHIATELILATSRHDVTLNGNSLGKVSVLPPTLTAQYHFAPDARIRPYLGAGLNYTRFYRVGLGGLDVDRNSTGGALQAGVDIQVSRNGFINLDAKKIYMKTDVKANGSTLTTLKIDPVVLGIGYGWRF